MGFEFVERNPIWGNSSQKVSNDMSAQKETALRIAYGENMLLLHETPYDWALEEINTFMAQAECNKIDIYSYNDVVCVFGPIEFGPMKEEGDKYKCGVTMKYKIIRKSDVIKTA
jgi:hypothetical protein